MEIILGSQVLDEDSLHTLFCEIEAIINSRPLSAISSDCGDILPITPNKLLNMGDSPRELSLPETYCYSKRRWGQVQHLADQFWIQFRRQYIQNLQQREKWFKKKTNVKIGDIVIMVNENLPRCHWPLARISYVKVSSDGLVRSVKVKRENKEYERPLSKLILILEDEGNLGNL